MSCRLLVSEATGAQIFPFGLGEPASGGSDAQVTRGASRREKRGDAGRDSGVLVNRQEVGGERGAAEPFPAVGKHLSGPRDEVPHR